MHPKLFGVIALWLIAGLVVGWSGPPVGKVQSAAGNPHPAAPQASPSPTCYTWEFFNNTGSDATGLVVNLKGFQSISDVYAGVLNPFGAPDPSSGFNPATGVYTLVFNNGTAYAGDQVQVGICTGSPILHLDSIPLAFYWVAQGIPQASAPLFVGLETAWNGRNQLQVRLFNEQATLLNLFSLTAVLPPDVLSLDDLNNGIVSTLPLVSEQVTDPIAMAGGGAANFTIRFDQVGVVLSPGQPVILQGFLSSDIDPGDAIFLDAQVSPPAAQIYMPLVTR